jgi:hypothetical protein
MLSDETLRQYEEELDGNEAIEVTFRRLRRDGHSRLEAVRVILNVLDVSLAEAKRVLLTSDTWADAFEETRERSPSSSSSVPPAPG